MAREVTLFISAARYIQVHSVQQNKIQNLRAIFKFFHFSVFSLGMRCKLQGDCCLQSPCFFYVNLFSCFFCVFSFLGMRCNPLAAQRTTKRDLQRMSISFRLSDQGVHKHRDTYARFTGSRLVERSSLYLYYQKE